MVITVLFGDDVDWMCLSDFIGLVSACLLLCVNFLRMGLSCMGGAKHVQCGLVLGLVQALGWGLVLGWEPVLTGVGLQTGVELD